MKRQIMKQFVLLIPQLFLLSTYLVGQGGLQQAINTFAKDDQFTHASVGISVIEVESGKQIASHEAQKSLLPASSLKVVTTASALAILGEDFTFKTELQYDGTIDDSGTLKGNLYVKGYGDPTLGSSKFDAAMKLDAVMTTLVAAVQKVGIKKIDGMIVGDASYFDSAVSGRTWPWEDMGNYYGAGAWGLNIHDNLYYLHFQQNAKLGVQPKIKFTDPAIPNFTLINEIRSAGKNTGDNAYIFAAPFSYTAFVRGTIPIGSKTFTIKGAIPEPPFLVAHLLMKELEVKGVLTNRIATTQLELEREGYAEKKRTTIKTINSLPLKTIVKETNLKSVNLYCESMLRAIGQKVAGIGSSEEGLKAIYDFWSKKGLKTAGFFMEDGSGLSIRNSVASFHLASIMRLVAKDKTLYDSFYTSLPDAGKTGSLKYMFKGTAAIGKLKAKSGGMSRVRSYTGYARSKSGTLLAFSIIANNFEGSSSTVRKKMEKVMLSMCE